MSNEELEQLRQLNDKFLADAERVASILKEDLKTNREARFADKFYIEDDTVCFEGEEHWSYGGYEHHIGYFPLSYLAMSDEELTNLVTERNKEYQKEKKKKKKRQKEKERERKLEQFKNLKSELGL